MLEGSDTVIVWAEHLIAAVAVIASALVTTGVVIRARRAKSKRYIDKLEQQNALQIALDQASAAIRDLSTYRAALDAYAIVAITDAKGNITHANDRFCEISGYAREELLGRNHRILNSRHHPKGYFVDMWRTIGRGEFWHGEICNKAKDGRAYWVDTMIIPLLGQGGRPEQFIAVRHDITERKLAEERARLSAMVTTAVADIQAAFIGGDWKQAFEAALSQVNAITQSEYGIIAEVLEDEAGVPRLHAHAATNEVWDETVRSFHANDDAKRLDGRNLSDLFGKAVATREAVIANDDAGRDDPGVHAFMALPIVVYGELVGMIGVTNRPGGYSSQMAEALRPLCDMLGQLVISKRNKDALWESQVALAESEQRFRGLTDIAADWCWQTNAELRFTHATSGFTTLTGMSEEWLTGRTLDGLANLSTKIGSADQADDAIAAHEDFRDHCVIIQTASGATRYMRLHARAQRNDKGEFQGYLGTAEDITEATQNTQMNQQADRLHALGTMAAGLAHEFNNILGIVAGHSELARLALQRGEHDLTHLDPISEAARRGARLTKSLLAFGRTKGSSVAAPIELGTLMTELKLFLKPLIGPSYKIEMRADGEDLAISANKDLLIQALVNLVLNARDAMPHGGAIRVRARAVTMLTDGGEMPAVEVGVTDRGPGIASDMIMKIFDPFFTTKEVGKGTGLGLPLVFRFAKENSGEVRVRSKLGLGSKFSITLPRADVAAMAEAGLPVADQEISLDGRTALLVDDEPALVAAYGEMLRNLGMKVKAFTSAYEALAAIDEGEIIDILVSDVLMPELDGPKLVGLAKSLKPDLKALLVTGQPERMGSDKTAGLENVDILQKPFEMTELRRALANALARRDPAADSAA